MLKHDSHKRRISLRVYIDGYLQDLASHGYAEKTQRYYRADLLRLIEYAECHGIHSAKQFIACAHDLLFRVSARRCTRGRIRSTVNRFFEYLARHNITAITRTKVPKTKYAQLIDEYIQFQIGHRGICREYAKAIRRYCICFFGYLQSRDIRRLSALTPDVVLDFITENNKKYKRKSISVHISILRCLLTYLYRSGVIRRDISGVLIRPRIYKNEACPRFISTSQIKAVLSQIDQTTIIGTRDYAMILLLATYGLRGIEVIRLYLDDIDWRRRIIHIKGRKGGNNSDYPLSSFVGDAIIEYLQKARPQSDDRHIFLSTKPPHRPFPYISSMGCMVRKYIKKARIEITRPGTHTFRYSCAQTLLNQKTPLKVISDYLGHMQPDTTQMYLKISLEDLREVACGVGEEVIL